MPKPTRLTISYNDNIRFSYTVDMFNQCLHVKLGRGVPDFFMTDAVSEAYEDYNRQHPDNEFIHPSAVNKVPIEWFSPEEFQEQLNNSPNKKAMTESEKITDLKALLAEAKEALMNRDPKTREKECYDSGHTPCRCTLCKINEALKPDSWLPSLEEWDRKSEYEKNKAAKVGARCCCPSCSTEFIKESYQQIFCKTKDGTICKDAYWNREIPSRRNNTPRKGGKQRNGGYVDEGAEGWDGHKD